MGDHYCCITCLQHYSRCNCDKEERAKVEKERQDKAAEKLLASLKPKADRRIQLGALNETPTISADVSLLEDIRYFHDKLQRYKDVKSATQLIKAVESLINNKI